VSLQTVAIVSCASGVALSVLGLLVYGICREAQAERAGLRTVFTPADVGVIAGAFAVAVCLIVASLRRLV
jgi:hypothetical protein